MDTEQVNIVLARIDKIDAKVQDNTNQLDTDRRDIDQIRIDQSAIRKGQEAILQQLIDFKQETRQIIEDTIANELPRIVRKTVQQEIRLLSKNNPKKVIKGRFNVLQQIINKLKRK